MKSSILSILNNNGSLLTKTFINLIFQLSITALTVYLLRNREVSGFVMIISFILLFVIMFPILISNLPIIYKLILFIIFSIGFGITLSPVNKVNKEVLTASVIGTISIFITFFIMGLIITSYGYNISWLGGILLISLFILIITGLISMICGVSTLSHKVYLYFGLLVFSLYVLFDTNQILSDSTYKKDFISASMGYYLDVINIFIKLVSILKNK
jgi:FtsH-binding integral membrane protein